MRKRSKTMREKKEQKCRACGQPFVHIRGTNIISCSNPQCDGKQWFTDENGNKKFKYVGTYFLKDSTPLTGGVKWD
jgi:ssDNA-binding Zn-finger/Zn-ribbon topoisomerase 1